MKRNLLALALLSAIATQASAVLNLNLNQSEFTYTPGTASTIQLFGTITGLNADVATRNIGFANSNITFDYSDEFNSYFNDNTLANFPSSGNPGLLGTINIPATGVTGLIDGASTVITVGDGSLSDNEYIRITPVPEPSAFAALGLGAMALIRRRRRA